jgi:hypothetical protein
MASGVIESAGARSQSDFFRNGKLLAANLIKFLSAFAHHNLTSAIIKAPHLMRTVEAEADVQEFHMFGLPPESALMIGPKCSTVPPSQFINLHWRHRACNMPLRAIGSVQPTEPAFYLQLYRDTPVKWRICAEFSLACGREMSWQCSVWLPAEDDIAQG